MSELKIYKQSDILWGLWFTEYYLKSVADKVLTEKDAQILDLIERVQKERAAKVDYKRISWQKEIKFYRRLKDKYIEISNRFKEV